MMAKCNTYVNIVFLSVYEVFCCETTSLDYPIYDRPYTRQEFENIQSLIDKNFQVILPQQTITYKYRETFTLYKIKKLLDNPHIEIE